MRRKARHVGMRHAAIKKGSARGDSKRSSISGSKSSSLRASRDDLLSGRTPPSSPGLQASASAGASPSGRSSVVSFATDSVSTAPHRAAQDDDEGEALLLSSAANMADQFAQRLLPALADVRAHEWRPTEHADLP